MKPFEKVCIAIKQNMYTNVGNYGEYTDGILLEYQLPDKKTQHEWDAIKYYDLSTVMMKICRDCCVADGDSELLACNPDVIIERHHHILTKDGKVKNQFAPHCDHEGPAGGPCRSILYYYQIDDGIEDVGLHFYEWKDEASGVIDQENPKETFVPRSGDVVTFKNNVPHAPGDFRTDSESPRVRGLFAIFIKYPKKKSRFSCCR